MDEDAIAAILAQCGPPNERLIAFERVLHLCGDNAALIQAVTAWGALCRADEREKAAQICDDIATDLHAQYKGHPPHAPNNPARADSHVESMSDGADLCAAALRSP